MLDFFICLFIFFIFTLKELTGAGPATTNTQRNGQGGRGGQLTALALNLKGEGGKVMIFGAWDEDQQEESCLGGHGYAQRGEALPLGLRVEREEK